MYIYLDVIILLNVIANGLILYLTGWALGLRHRRIGMIVAIIASVGYAIAGMFQYIQFLYHPMIKFFVSALLIILALQLRSLRQFAQALGTFYLISFILGGAVLGYSFFMRSSAWTAGLDVLPERTSLALLAKGLLVGSSAVYFLIRPLYRRRMKQNYLYPVEIMYQGKTIRVTGYLDTGNQLYTMGGKFPVILIEREAVEPLLSKTVTQYMERTVPEQWIEKIEGCGDYRWLERIHLISYRGIGGSNLMLGFRADEVSIITDEQNRRIFSCVIGIYGTALSADGSYHALLHSEIFQC